MFNDVKVCSSLFRASKHSVLLPESTPHARLDLVDVTHLEFSSLRLVPWRTGSSVATVCCGSDCSAADCDKSIARLERNQLDSVRVSDCRRHHPPNLSRQSPSEKGLQLRPTDKAESSILHKHARIVAIVAAVDVQVRQWHLPSRGFRHAVHGDVQAQLRFVDARP